MRHHIRPSTTARTFGLERALWPAVAVFSAIIPLIVSPNASDVFREPKELFVRAAAIVFLAVVALILVWQPRLLRALRLDRLTATAVAIVAAATAIAFLASTNRLLSERAIAYCVPLLILFWATFVAV